MKVEVRVQQAWKKRNKLRKKRDKLWAESNKLYAEGGKLWAEGDILFLNAVIAVYGDITVEWKNWDHKKQAYECHLGNGIVLKP